MSASRSRSPSQRQLRVGEELRHVLAQLLSRADFADPDLAEANITVTEVRMSPDLRNASAFVIPLGTRVDRLDFVGLTEDYARSLQLFEAIFGCELIEYRRNVNQARPDDYGTYLQDRGVHQTVSRLMAENQRTYDLARRRFETLCRDFGV